MLSVNCQNATLSGSKIQPRFDWVRVNDRQTAPNGHIGFVTDRAHYVLRANLPSFTDSPASISCALLTSLYYLITRAKSHIIFRTTIFDCTQ